MIFPYGQEKNSVRLLPWITIAIVLINFLIHWNVTSKNKEVFIEVMGVARELINYYVKHPYLVLNTNQKKDQINYEEASARERFFKKFRKNYEGDIPEESIVAEEQKMLDLLMRRLDDAKANSPFIKWGFTPAKKNIKNSFSYMFIHGGWIHLLSNLFLLYLVGPYIEDVWGKLMYTLAYLAVGALSAFAYAAHYPDMAGPLIGASGAISGILGAFLVRFWHAKIKFFYWFWFIFGTFRAPAWLMIPLWFGNEILTAKQMDSLYKNGSGVAHWAHIWGFVFGVLIAVAISYFKFEQKVINKKYNEKFTFTNKGFLDYEEALKLKEAGKIDEAFTLLLESAKRDIKNTDVIEMLWVLGEEIGKIDEVKPHFIKHIEYELRTERFEAAHFHYNKLLGFYPDVSINTQLSVVLLKHLTENELKEEAEKLADLVYERTKTEVLPGFLVLFSEVLLRLNTKHCKTVVDRTLSSPDVPDLKKDELKKALDEYLKSSKNIAGDTQEKKIGVIRAIPISVNRESFVLKINEKGKTTLLLNKIKMISVVKIIPLNSKTIYLIDMFMDDYNSETANIRIIRFYSIDFDPGKFIPNAENVGDAFKKFILAILKFSNAKPFYDLDYLTLKKVKTFPSIEEYNDSLNKH